MSLHRDARLIDALGRTLLKQHFQCSDTLISRWRRDGVSKNFRNPFKLLCLAHGLDG